MSAPNPFNTATATALENVKSSLDAEIESENLLDALNDLEMGLLLGRSIKKLSKQEVDTLAKELKEDTYDLKSLNIHGTKEDNRPKGLGDVLQALSQNTNLHRISFGDLSLSHLDFNGLNNMLHKNSNLARARLEDVDMDADATNDLAEGIVASKSILDLSLVNVNISNPSAKKFISALGINSSLEILFIKNLEMDDDVQDVSDDGQDLLSILYRTLAASRNLKNLSLDLYSGIENQEVFSAFTNGLNQHSSLTELQLGDVETTGLKLLGKALANSNVENLTVYVTDDETETEDNRSGLEVLALELANNHCLKFLSILRTGVGEHYCITDKVGFALALALSRNTTLRTLELESLNDIGVEGMVALFRIIAEGRTNLENLFLIDTGFNEAITYVTEMLKSDLCKLKGLSLKDTWISYKNYQLLKNALLSNEKLTSLAIRVVFEKKDTVNRIHLLAEMLKKNRNLQALHLRYLGYEGDGISRYHFSSTDIKVLEEALKVNPSLTSFYVLEDCDDDDEPKPQSEVSHADVEPLNKYLRRNVSLLTSWTEISFLLSFLRANRGHAFQYSGIPLFSTILEMACPKDFSLLSKCSFPVKVKYSSIPRIKIDSFIKSKFFQANLAMDNPKIAQTTTPDATATAGRAITANGAGSTKEMEDAIAQLGTTVAPLLLSQPLGLAGGGGNHDHKHSEQGKHKRKLSADANSTH